eukprot:137202-Prorocentrum_minimum.AAC.1
MSTAGPAWSLALMSLFFRFKALVASCRFEISPISTVPPVLVNGSVADARRQGRLLCPFRACRRFLSRSVSDQIQSITNCRARHGNVASVKNRREN